jgi:hypothetical protein
MVAGRYGVAFTFPYPIPHSRFRYGQTIHRARAMINKNHERQKFILTLEPLPGVEDPISRAACGVEKSASRSWSSLHRSTRTSNTNISTPCCRYYRRGCADFQLDGRRGQP